MSEKEKLIKCLEYLDKNQIRFIIVAEADGESLMFYGDTPRDKLVKMLETAAYELRGKR